VNPQAVSPLLDRQAPGIVHALLAASLQKTPLAALSRPVAGTLDKTLVVTLPGSPRAVRECLDTLLSNGLVFHAIDLNRGGGGQTVHSAMARGASGAEQAQALAPGDAHSHYGHGHNHEHHHHHHHSEHEHHAPKQRTVLSNDPSQPGERSLVDIQQLMLTFISIRTCTVLALSNTSTGGCAEAGDVEVELTAHCGEDGHPRTGWTRASGGCHCAGRSTHYLDHKC
jgi:hypothetical protein